MDTRFTCALSAKIPLEVFALLPNRGRSNFVEKGIERALEMENGELMRHVVRPASGIFVPVSFSIEVGVADSYTWRPGNKGMFLASAIVLQYETENRVRASQAVSFFRHLPYYPGRSMPGKMAAKLIAELRAKDDKFHDL